MATFPAWLFDGSEIPDPLGKGERVIQWVRRLKHPKNRAHGNAFELDSWQERILRRLYGDCNPDGSRKFRRLCLLLPRGNRKTSLCALIALIELIGPESVPGALILSAASAREQSRELFKELSLITLFDKRLQRHLRVKPSAGEITYPAHGAEYKAVSADGNVQHGKTPSLVIADELHVWKGIRGRELWDALNSALVKTRNTLLIVATTAGRGQDNIAHEFVTYCSKVQSGEITDPHTLPIIFSTEKDDDWSDERLWRQVNPGLSCEPPYPDIDGFRDTMKKAMHMRGAELDSFLQFNLNVWLETFASGAFNMDAYDAGSGAIDLDTLKGKPCWVGVDLSRRGDLTAVCAVFKDGDEFVVLPHIFAPKEGLRERAAKDDAPYVKWADEGFLLTNDGPTIDFGAVERCIRDLCSIYSVQELLFDKTFASEMMDNLLKDGHRAVNFSQGWQQMGPATADLLKTVADGKLRHGGHPALRRAFANAVTVRSDRNDNVALHKGHSRARIDAVVATAMALARAKGPAPQRSVFEDPDLDPSYLVLDF